MKPFWFCVVIILTSLGTSTSGNDIKDEVNVVSDTQDSFLQRIVIDENALRHIDLTSTDLQLVTLRPKQPKEHQTASMENIVSNHQQDSSIGKRPTIDPRNPFQERYFPW
ncbi:hypothetical protein OS493_009936 [Desmophyllum pertusum]|uniref:Uncharacterized protein n=1 Tax=Desmophyllum pertusum TaxID=174260 RepID=A0A9X0CFZ9_9CNID|nr:hypothetical protein OS493_009936 [Desmophyllum pertusum]